MLNSYPQFKDNNSVDPGYFKWAWASIQTRPWGGGGGGTHFFFFYNCPPLFFSDLKMFGSIFQTRHTQKRVLISMNNHGGGGGRLLILCAPPPTWKFVWEGEVSPLSPYWRPCKWGGGGVAEKIMCTQRIPKREVPYSRGHGFLSRPCTAKTVVLKITPPVLRPHHAFYTGVKFVV